MYVIENPNMSPQVDRDNQKSYSLISELGGSTPDNIDDDSATYITQDGYLADARVNPLTKNIEFIRHVGGEISGDAFGSDSEEVKLAHEHGLTHYAYLMKLIWKEDGQPELLSDDQHIVLGWAVPGDFDRLSFYPYVTMTYVGTDHSEDE